MESLKLAPVREKDAQNKLVRLFNVFIPLAIFFGALAGVLVVVLDNPKYILMGLAGIAVFLISLYSAEFGLVVLIAISYTRFSDVVIEYHGFPSFAKPFLIILIVSILLRWALFQERPKGWFNPAFMFGILSLAGFASLIYSPVPDRVFERLLNDAKDTVIAIVIVLLLQKDQAFRRVIWTLIGVAIFLGTLSVFQYLTGTFDNVYGGFAISLRHQIIGTIDDYRATGPIGDPNFFGQIMVVLVPISFERFLHEKQLRLRLFALWGMVASILTVILTYSRGGLVAMLLGLAVMFLFYPPKRSQVPFIIFSLIVFIALLPPNYLDRLFTLSEIFQTSNTNRFEERSLRGRLSENLTALEMIKANPLFGVGLNSYKYLFPLYSKKLGLALVATEREAHNMFLEVAAETGIIGFTVFSFLLIASFRSVLNARRIFMMDNLMD